VTNNSDAITWLRSPGAIRERCGMIFAAAARGELAHFTYVPERLPELAKFVVTVIRENYPTLDIPYHSRWRHFAVGGRDRWAALATQLSGMPDDEIARVRFDLAVTSVFLDAGAGDAWRYREPVSDAVFSRSEGLAVASFDLFAAGAFTSVPVYLLADADALERFDAAQLAAAFQVRPDNPLIGLEGRAELLRRLGAALRADPELFGQPPRIGHLFDYLSTQAQNGVLPAPAILAAILRGFGPIWPGRVELDGVNLGDVWRHPAARAGDATSGLVPFHKLSQWLAYSLVEPLEAGGTAVTELNQLTGLPEYRNGGLFVDGGVLVPKHDAVLREPHEVGSEIVVEWRALTVALLDLLAEPVRAELGLDAASLPLAKVLEGGTWSAGRRLARERRPDGGPPIRVISDGTVF
jgi:hypothetical protein